MVRSIYLYLMMGLFFGSTCYADFDRSQWLESCITAHETKKVGSTYVAIVSALADQYGDGASTTAQKCMNIFDNAKKVTDLSMIGKSLVDLNPIRIFSETKFLQLANNNIKDLSFLSDLVGLKTLDLSNNKISNIEPISHLKSLSVLHLTNNVVSEFRFLIGCRSLCLLFLRDEKRKDEVVNYDENFERKKAYELLFLKFFMRRSSCFTIDQLIPERIFSEERKRIISHLDFLKSLKSSYSVSFFRRIKRTLKESNCSKKFSREDLEVMNTSNVLLGLIRSMKIGESDLDMVLRNYKKLEEEMGCSYHTNISILTDENRGFEI